MTVERPPLRVLMVLGRMQASGTESLLHLAGARWADRGITVAIVGIDLEIGPFASDLASVGYELHHRPRRPFVRFVPSYMRLVRQYDVVHVHLEHFNILLILLARLAGRPVVRTHHNVRSFAGRKRMLKLAARRVTRALGVHQVAVSESVQADERASLRNPSTVVWNCYDTSRFSVPTAEERAQARAALGVSKDCFVVVCIGNCNEQKNHVELLKAFTHLPDDVSKHLVHVGQEQPGNPERGIIDAAESTFTGSVADVVPYLQAADCFAMPSLWEGLGIAALEAIATGVPAVLSDVRGLRDQRHACAHITWTGTDAESIRRGLEDVMRSRRQPCGCSDLVRDRFSPESFVNGYEAVFRQAASPSRDSR